MTLTGLDLVQKSDVALVRLARPRYVRDDVPVLNVRELFRERGELVEVRREHAEGADLGGDVPALESASWSDVDGQVRRTLRLPTLGQTRRTSRYRGQARR
jgi:hypothetical protein